MNSTLSNNEKLYIISNLATMLNAGIPILEAIDSLLEDSKGNSKKILEQLKSDINQGNTISSSLARSPKAFDTITISLIKASEESGTLDQTLKDLTMSVKKDMEFSEKIKSALAYPILVIVVFFGILLLMLVYVIPRISAVFSRIKVTLPLPTKILIFSSNILLKNYVLVIIVGIIALFLLVIFYKTQKKTLIRFFHSLPGLSRLAQEIDLTRFNRSMSLLLSSGISIIEALQLSQNVVEKKDIQTVVSNCIHMVGEGKKLTDGYKSAKHVIPGIMIRITEAGEKSGSLEKSTQEISEYFDNQVSNTLKTLTTLLEPALLVIIGIFVGGMMLAIIAPIYQMIGNINVR